MQNNMSDQQQDSELLRKRMGRIRHKILVLSGKGGVGKSTVSVNLAAALALKGSRVGILDVDIHGPSIPKILDLEGVRLKGSDGVITPVQVNENLSAMSIGLMLRSPDDPVIWRGPMKYNMIKQFLSDVGWSDLDYLIVDSPPGTGDEPLAVAQLIENADGAVIVTTPQQLAVTDVRKSISFCRQLELPVLGVVENMSGFVCSGCGTAVDIFKSGGGENMALEMNVPFLGRIPIDRDIVDSCDSGRPYIESYMNSSVSNVFMNMVLEVSSRLEKAD